MISELDDLIFRSKTERMWAMVIVESGYSLQYEPQTFKTEHGFYCPDFYIRELDLYIEVKGKPPTDIEREKLSAVQEQTGSECMFLCGMPDADVNGPVSGAMYPLIKGPAIGLNLIWNVDKGPLLLAAISRAKAHVSKPFPITHKLASGCLSGNYDLVTPGTQITILGKSKKDQWLQRATFLVQKLSAVCA